MSAEDRRLSTAYHEAGHAVVAWALGVPVRHIEIDRNGDDSAGGSEVGDSKHLPMVDQVAICLAGMEAQELFECPTHVWAGVSDYDKFFEMIDDDMPDEERERLRSDGFARARALLNANREQVTRLAAALVENGRVDGRSFEQG